MTISISDLPAIWQPIKDPVIIADASDAVLITPPANVDGVIIWTETQDIRVKVLPESSTDVATASEGIPIAVEDGLRFIPTYKAKISLIESTAGADVQYFFISFLK